MYPILHLGTLGQKSRFWSKIAKIKPWWNDNFLTNLGDFFTSRNSQFWHKNKNFQTTYSRLCSFWTKNGPLTHCVRLESSKTCCGNPNIFAGGHIQDRSFSSTCHNIGPPKVINKGQKRNLVFHIIILVVVFLHIHTREKKFTGSTQRRLKVSFLSQKRCKGKDHSKGRQSDLRGRRGSP